MLLLTKHCLSKLNKPMSEHGEMSAPAPQEQPQGHQPDMVVAPKNPPNSEDRPGVAGRLTELKQNPSLLTTLTQPKQEAGATSETSPAFPPMTSVERDGGYDWTKKPKSIDGQFHY